MAMRDTKEPGSVQLLHLRIDDIKREAVCLPGNRWRAVMEVSSVVSFALLADTEREVMFNNYRAFLNSLSFPIQIMYRSEPVDLGPYDDRMRAHRERLAYTPLEPLAESCLEHLHFLAERYGLLEQRYYIAVPAEEGAAGAAVGWHALRSSLDRRRRANAARLDEEARLTQLETRCDAVARGLSKCGGVAQRLDDAELASLFYSCWSPDQSRIQRLRATARRALDEFVVTSPHLYGAPDGRPRQGVSSFGNAVASRRGLLRSRTQPARSEVDSALELGSRSVLDHIAPASIEVQRDHIRLENLYARTLKLTDYPRRVDAGWLDPLISFDRPLQLSMHITPISVSEAMGSLKHKLAVLETSRTLDAGAGKLKDPERDQSLGDNNRVRDALASGVERLFAVSVYVTVTAASLRELDSVTERVEEEFDRIMAATRHTTFKQDTAYHAALPEATDGIRAVRNLDTTSVATMIPFTSGGLSMEGGLVWGISPHNRGLVQVDPFDPALQNYNMTVFASSGSGKSYAIKKGLLNAAYTGLRWVVIDPDGEYRTLVLALGGQLVELAVGSSHHINPLDLPAYSGDDKEMEGLSRHVNELIGWLEIMCAPAEGFTSQEQAVLDRALYDAYKSKGITPDPQTHDNEPPILNDLLEALGALPGAVAEHLAIRLERYVSGSLSGLFNHPTNVDLDSDYIVFDVFGIKDPNQQALALHMITKFIWRQITGEVRPRILVIDEAWTLMQHAKGGEFLFEFAKKARKRYLAVWTITQDIEDFMNSHHGRAVVNNSSMKLLLRHDTDAAIRAVADVFKLSADDRALLRRADPGDGLFYVRNTHVPIRIVASSDEHALITTKPAELVERQTRRQEGETGARRARSNGHVASYAR